MNKTSILIYLIAIFIVSFSEVLASEPFTENQLLNRFVKYQYSENPNYNKAVKFEISLINIENLWEQLEGQLFAIESIFEDGEKGDENAYLFLNNIILPLGFKFGLRSVLVNKGKLYISFVSGSGIERAHVTLLEISDNQVVKYLSEEFIDKDLFLVLSKNNNVLVKEAIPIGLNKFLFPRYFGEIGKTQNNKIFIVNKSGNEIKPDIKFK